jgi:hypothetical protein
MSTNLPDDHDPLAAARREAAARAHGSKNRYLMATGDIIDVTVRKRKQMNFRKSKAVHLTLAGTAMSFIVAAIIGINKDAITHSAVRLAESLFERDQAQVQVASASNVEPVIGKSPKKGATGDASQYETESTGDLEPGKETSESESTASNGSDDDHLNDQGIKQVQKLQTDVPISASTSLRVVQDTKDSPVVLMPMPLENEQKKRTVPPPNLEVAPAPRPMAKPRQQVPEAQQASAPLEPPVSPELVSAVNDARSRVESKTNAKQPVKSSTGVFVELPNRNAHTSTSRTDSAAPKIPPEVESPITAREFSVVTYLPGGLLVRDGKYVIMVHVGEPLPNGKRLVSVNQTIGAYTAE